MKYYHTLYFLLVTKYLDAKICHHFTLTISNSNRINLYYVLEIIEKWTLVTKKYILHRLKNKKWLVATENRWENETFA